MKRYGRSGQRQHGIDISGPVSINGTRLGLGVCQARSSETINWGDVAEDLKKVDAHFVDPVPFQFVLATGSKRSTADHDKASKLSTQRLRDGRCPVVLLDWIALSEWVKNDPDLMLRHFPDYVKVTKKVVLKVVKKGLTNTEVVAVGVLSAIIGGVLSSLSSSDDDGGDGDGDPDFDDL